MNASTTLPDRLHEPPAAQRMHPRTSNARSSGRSAGFWMIACAALAIAAVGVWAVVSGTLTFGPPGESATDVVGNSSYGRTWSYYHDSSYAGRASSAKYESDRSRSTDPAESALGDTSRWVYDGPYRYGTYGSAGMRSRARGSSTDPLYASSDALPDVFHQYGGNLDPSGGRPVGTPPSSMTNPYYDPYGGYSNPYANRIRLAYGEGYGRGAAIDALGTATP